MHRISIRLRKVTGSLPRLDDESVGRVVGTNWLRVGGVAIDPMSGETQERDWRRIRAEASWASTPSRPCEPVASSDPQP